MGLFFVLRSVGVAVAAIILWLSSVLSSGFFEAMGFSDIGEFAAH